MITENSTPLEIIKLNRNTEHLFNRYGIEKSNKPIYQHSISKNLNNNLLIDLLECYEDIDKIKIDKFSKYRLPLLIDYLKKSHDYYISKRIPEIEQSISIFLEAKYAVSAGPEVILSIIIIFISSPKIVLSCFDIK